MNDRMGDEKLAFLMIYEISVYGTNLDERIAHSRRPISYELISKRIAAVKKGRGVHLSEIV